MGIEEVKKEILDNARKQAKQILKEAEREREGILKSAESRVDVIKEKLDREAENTIAQYRTMVLAEANSQVKKQRLVLERELVNEVFKQSKEELKKLNIKKREQHLKKILQSKFKFNKVYCSIKDSALLKKYKPLQAEIIGGAILENKEGDIRVDVSYETLLKSIKQDNLAEIAKILFS
jgi:vacuolar-type H+-ATPase subunit E/Vma4